MPDLRNLELLVSLAHHEHFSHAAKDCGISQPAFSARLRKMEQDFKMPLVRRGNKFMGFTNEGEVVLKWARKILTEVEGMVQEVDALSNDLRGKLVVGTVPTALPFAAVVASHLRKSHPQLSIEIQSLSSSQIDRGLNDFSLDAGITYVQDADPEATEILYDERYVLIAPKSLAPRTVGTVTWAEAASLPLCLLTQNMRNRRFMDDVFARIKATPTIVMETNGFTAALAQVERGSAATIAPRDLVTSIFAQGSTVRLDLVEPVVTHAIGLSIKESEPALPVIAALRQAIENAL